MRYYHCIIFALSLGFVPLNAQHSLSDSIWIIQTSEPQKSLESFVYNKWKNEAPQLRSIFEPLNLYELKFNSAVHKKHLTSLFQKEKLELTLYPNIQFASRATPNDPDFFSQWSLPHVGMTDVWDITQGRKAPNGDDIVVAILDEGFDLSHPELINQIWINEGEVPGNGIDDDNNGYIDDIQGWNSRLNNGIHNNALHGTEVIGVIGARGNNNNQVTGVLWDAKMMLVSGSNQNGQFDLGDIVEGLGYIYEQRKLYNDTQGEQGAYVVVSNFSGGAENLFPEDFPPLCEIYDLLGSVGILSFSAAPNNPIDVEIDGDLPSTCTSPYLVTVTNTDRQDQLYQFAGYGSESIDIGAPGVDIWTTGANNSVSQNVLGTSVSTPLVAGIATLLYSELCEEKFYESLSDPSPIPLEIRSALLQTAVRNIDLQQLTTSGGRIDALAALENWRSRKEFGDCCQVAINTLNLVDESCEGAMDGSIEITVDSTDIRGILNYSIDAGSITARSNSSGEFRRLGPELYTISVSALRDATCSADTVLALASAGDTCAFGTFGIRNVFPNPVTSDQDITIQYELDELKIISFYIYNMNGQLVYKNILRPEADGRRLLTIPSESLEAGVYYATMRANDIFSHYRFIVAD